MISAESSDDRKRLSLSYGFEGGKMELDTEIEEGEACFLDNNEADSTIDPDISLSYIDEKIQNILGDCRKDFEGGVSAENLGAKFGGYGSFLPTYQRSPVWPHPKTPPKVVTHSASVSPNNAHIEVSHQNSVTQSSASHPTRNGPIAPPRGSSKNRKSKQEVKKSTSNGQRPVNDSDQKSLKVRIKVGSDNFSKTKKAEIYSGLGLDISPSSSLEASPADSDGFFNVPQDGPDESPTSILEMMTSFPISGSLLLSPLPYDILHLTEKEKWEDISNEPVQKVSQESTLTALHGSDSSKVDQNVLEKKSKSKSTEKNSASMESTNGDDIRKDIELLPKKETSMDDFAPRNKPSSSEAKRKSKGQDLDNDGRNVNILKSGIKNESFTSKSKKLYAEDLKKNSGKVRETYKDFFGELDLEDEDHEIHDDKMDLEKDFVGKNEKGILGNKDSLKEALIGKKSEKPSSLAYPRVSSHVPIMENGVVSDVAAAAPTVVPVVNEDWVCCDKCEKWRLLPPGVNPGSLPEKWLCSMLDWLPGMNRCSISEEETTKAITSRFPGPSIHGTQPVHPGGPQLGPISLDASRPDGPHQPFDSQNVIKKKHVLKDVVTNEIKQERPSMSSNSSKKNRHNSYKTRSLNQSPFGNDVDFQDSGHSRDVIVEKDRLKRKESNKLREKFVDEGNNIHQPKTNNKRESTQDFPKDSKKIKTENNIENVHMGKIDKRDITKKRKKTNEFEGTEKYSKETSENHYKKEKKPRVLKSDNEEIRKSKGKIVEDVKFKSLDLIDSSRKDTILAATSSSSKVSGSRKTKINRGSPVESVSSSPLRSLNTIKSIELPKKNIDTRPHEEKLKGVKKVKGGASTSSENAKTYNQSKHKHRIGPISNHDSKKDVSRKGKSNSLPPRSQSEIERVNKSHPGSRKEKGGSTLPVKVLKPNKKVENQTMNVKKPIPDVNKGKGQDGPVLLVNKDISNQATTNALREATNLKHMADRVKNAGSSTDSRALYMQAALKFLHVASIFETCHSQTGRYGDMIQAKSIYSSTAKLCKYCADEYERSKEMPTAALAYKCMEVAYMKVIYSSHATANKDVNELQTSLQIAPTDESPSSSASASDLDNLNNQAINGEKAAVIKGANPPQVAGNHVISAQHKPNFTRVLNFTQDVLSAMEASRKSRSTFAAADSKEEAILSAVKTALDFSFHDVEGLLHLVRLAMEVICR